jgi:hypothetical protein
VQPIWGDARFVDDHAGGAGEDSDSPERLACALELTEKFRHRGSESTEETSAAPPRSTVLRGLCVSAAESLCDRQDAAVDSEFLSTLARVPVQPIWGDARFVDDHAGRAGEDSDSPERLVARR